MKLFRLLKLGKEQEKQLQTVEINKKLVIKSQLISGLLFILLFIPILLIFVTLIKMTSFYRINFIIYGLLAVILLILLFTVCSLFTVKLLQDLCNDCDENIKNILNNYNFKLGFVYSFCNLYNIIIVLIVLIGLLLLRFL